MRASEPRGFLQVLFDVAAGVHDRGFAAVADQVRRLRETAEVELLEVHSLPQCVQVPII
jgi:hypothetical protein